jgi:hypothetical protein
MLVSKRMKTGNCSFQVTGIGGWLDQRQHSLLSEKIGRTVGLAKWNKGCIIDPAIGSTPSFKPARRSQNRNGLVHDPLANTEVVLYPSLDFFILGHLIGVETGAMKASHLSSHAHTLTEAAWAARRGRARVSKIGFLYSGVFLRNENRGARGELRETSGSFDPGEEGGDCIVRSISKEVFGGICQR